MIKSNHFSRKINTFNGRVLPEEGISVGYAQLLQILGEHTDRRLPPPAILALVTEKQQR